MTQLLAHLFGDYILQSDWMAQNKTKHWYPALIHAMVYSCCFIPLLATRNSTWAMVAICGTHFLIDRFRLARYVVWAKNWLGPRYRFKTKWTRCNERDCAERATHFDSNHNLYCEKHADEHNGPTQNCQVSGWAEWMRSNPPLRVCPTGYHPNSVPWMATWLLIIADNTLHLAINYAALRWL